MIADLSVILFLQLLVVEESFYNHVVLPSDVPLLVDITNVDVDLESVLNHRFHDKCSRQRELGNHNRHKRCERTIEYSSIRL